MEQLQQDWICPIPYSNRQNDILRDVHTTGFVGIDELAKHHNVSAQTIRRDVNILSAAGELRRMRGGVDMPAQRNNLMYSRRSALNLVAKKSIAQLVAENIEDGASLAVSIGTTPEVVVEALVGKSKLNIFTNNLNVAMLASTQPDWSVTIPGGAVRFGDRDVLGPTAETFFKGYCVDYGIFGVGGVAEDGSLLDFTDAEVRCRAAIQANCNTAYLVLDQSKFSRRAHVRGGKISSVGKVFCDAPPPAQITKILQKSSTQLVTPQKALSNA